MARICEFHQSIADKICDRLATGKSLRTICASRDMPGRRTVFDWLKKIPSFRRQYADAADFRADYLAWEIIDIADGEGDDARARLRIAARKWMLPRLAPRKYGNSTRW
jgi:hypothetical protein